jgi:hypothetical protein
VKRWLHSSPMGMSGREAVTMRRRREAGAQACVGTRDDAEACTKRDLVMVDPTVSKIWHLVGAVPA